LVTDTIDRGASLSDQATRLVRKRILEGVYRPGERLIEVELAAAFQISRAPLREALRSLAQEGIVTHRPNKGFYVPAITLDDARALYEFRQALETSAARWAATRATDAEVKVLRDLLDTTDEVFQQGEDAYPQDLDFHLAVTHAAHSPLIEQRAQEISRQLQVLRQRSGYSRDRARAAYEEHLAIAKAICDHDPDEAEHAMRVHLERSSELALSTIAEFLAEQ
jgi:DNA-binding GntR family transcriptional regulator